jgi:Protein of unknown function (DUF3237)
MAADSIPVEHLFTVSITAEMGEAYRVYNGPAGRRLIAGITGGTFAGPRLRGTVAPATGADWITVRPNKVLRIDVRLVLVTDDDAAIYMYYGGILKDGQVRTAPYFEVGDERYAWLNDVQAVGIGTVGPNGPTYDIYALQ